MFSIVAHMFFVIRLLPIAIIKGLTLKFYQNYFIKDASDNYVVPTSYDENETYYEKVRYVDNKIGTLKDNASKVNNIYLNDEINTNLMAKNIKAYFESLNN